jgi:hypothetical protein
MAVKSFMTPQALPTNIRPNLKGLSGTNAIAYLASSSVKTNVLQHWLSVPVLSDVLLVSKLPQNKVECLYL